MTLRTISLKMRGFVLGILYLAKLPNSGTNLILTGSQHYISATRRDHRIDPRLNADRAERRKRRQEKIDREISEKMKKLNEPGETVESNFSEVEHTCTTEETEESDELQDGRSEDEEMGELEMEMDVAGENLAKTPTKSQFSLIEIARPWSLL